MTVMQLCDILVVGAGPSGSCAAIAAAERGARTLLIDAKHRIGAPPHCGEFVPAQLFVEAALDRNCIETRVEYMETRIYPDDLHAAAGEDPWHDRENFATATRVIRSQGFIIDRVRFDRNLARHAASKGVTVLSGARLIGRDGSSWIFRYDGKELAVNPRLTIAADGAASTVARLLGMENPSCLRGIQAEVPLIGSWDRCLIFFRRDLEGGYGWLFPKKESANVGLGTVHGNKRNSKDLLEMLLDRLAADGIIRRGRFAVSAGLIPVSGMRSELVKDNVVFCGDAAGLTHPITGAGIPQAVRSGSLAGSLASEALRSGTDTPLRHYQQEIRETYEGILGHALAKRALMMRQWKDPDFRSTCEQTWIGFKDYRKRVRQ